MQRFKASLVLILISSLISACVSDKPSERVNEDTATFLADKVTGESFISELSLSGIPNQKTFTFKTCLKDYLQYKAIPDQGFTVVAGDRSIEAKTDSSGCLSWSEVVKFEVGKEPKWVTIERGIRASQTSHKGQRLLQLAVNPWIGKNENQVPAVVDLAHDLSIIPSGKLVPKDQAMSALTWSGSISGQYSDRPQFYVDVVSATLSEREFISEGVKGKTPGAELSLQLEFKPKIRVKGLYKDYTYVDLTRGAVEVKPYILVSGQNESDQKILMSEDVLPERIQFNEPLVRHVFKVKIPFAPSTGTFELGLRIRYVDESSVLPFEGLFFMGEVTSLLGKKSANLTAESQQALQKVYDNRANWDMGLKGDLKEDSLQLNILSQNSMIRGQDVKAGLGRISYRLSRPNPKFSAVDKDQCESSVQRLVQYQVETCVYNPLTLKGVPYTEFNVHVKDGDKLKLVDTKTTDYAGCMIWEHGQSHGYYNRERYLVNDFVVENKKLGVSEKLIIAINPWDYGFTFGKDASQLKNLVTTETLEKMNGKAVGSKDSPVPQLVLHNFTSNFLEQNYIIDDELNLVVKRRYRYQFIPRVLRHDSLVGGVGKRDDLRDGVYIVRFVLARHHQEAEGAKNNIATHKEESDRLLNLRTELNDSVMPQRPDRLPEYISHYEIPVVVRDGRITVDIDFSLQDLFLLGSRNSVIVEALPADPQGLVYLPNSGCSVDTKLSKFAVDKTTELRTWSYQAPQVLLDMTSAGGIFTRIAYSAKEIMDEAEKSAYKKKLEAAASKRKENRETFNLSKFADKEALRVIDLNQSQNLNGLTQRLNKVSATIDQAQRRNAFGMSAGEKAEIDAERSKEKRSQLNSLKDRFTGHFDKIRRKVFFQLGTEDVRDVIEFGIYESNRSDERVDMFAHAMCGFWADHFYEEYMNQKQIQAINDWMLIKEDVDSVEEWLRVGGSNFSQELKPRYPFKENLLFQPGRNSRTSAVATDVWQDRRGQDIIRRCLDDPFAFFVFDKKVIVDKVASYDPSNIVYLGGDAQNYNVSQAFRADQSVGWGSTRGYNVSSGGSIAMGALDTLLGPIKLAFAGFRVNGDWSTNLSEKRDRYRGQALNFNKGPWLIISRSNFEIELAQYRHCLNVYPSHRSFEGLDKEWSKNLRDKSADQVPYKRAGLMLCSETRKKQPNGQPMRVQESYYYLFQHFAQGTYMQDTNLVYNRPFLLGLRGKSEFEKFLVLTQGLVEPNYKGHDVIPGDITGMTLDPLVGVIKSFEVTKAHERTGFYPGIFTEVDPDAGRNQKKESSEIMKMFEWIASKNPLGWMDFPEPK